jgi:biotin synthase
MGMMIGVKGQSIDSLVQDLQLLERLQPQMIGIGPYIPHHDTPLGENPAGDLRLTLLMLAIVRIMFPDALIPSTTALATLSAEGRKMGILSGANVIMPNLTPLSERRKYAIYENKATSGSEAVEGLQALERELSEIGYHIDYSRGDFQKH